MKNGDFLITEDSTPDIVNLFIKGRIDFANSSAFQYQLEKNIKNGVKKIVANMSQVEFLSSAGIRVILLTHKTMLKTGGSFGIEEPSECVKNVLNMVALNELLA